MQRPGAALANRPLHFFYLCDTSGSMAIDGKIDTLNEAIREALPHMQDAAAENPNAQVLIRAIRFSTNASWHIGTPQDVETFSWPVIEKPSGLTEMGKSLRLLSQAMTVESMGDRALPPVIVLISDGNPTDDFEQARVEFMQLPWAKKSVRLAIAIGEDPDLAILQQFIGVEYAQQLAPLTARNPEDLVNYIKWASTVAIKASSAPVLQQSTHHTNDSIQTLPQVPDTSQILGNQPQPADTDDIW